MADDTSKPADGSAHDAPALGPSTEPAPSTSKPDEPASSTPDGPQHLTSTSTPSSSIAVPSSASAAAPASCPASASSRPVPSEPALPDRNYPKDARLLQYTPPPPGLPPNRALLRFLKGLLIVIFVLGSTASLCALVYQRFVLPKLLVTRARISALHRHNLTNYDKLVVSVYSLLKGSGSLYAATRRRLELRSAAADPTLPATAQADIAASIDEKDAKAAESDEKEESGSDTTAVEDAKEEQSPAARLTDPLRLSLDKLAATLSAYAPVAEESSSWDKLTKTEEPTSAQSLIKSLETLTNFLTNESFYAAAPSYPASAYGYNYGGANAMPSRSGTDKEKIQLVKSEIRSLKGALLTRKNFAAAK